MFSFSKTIAISLLLSTLVQPVLAADEEKASNAPSPSAPAEQIAQNSVQNSTSGTYIDIIPAPSVTNDEYPTAIDEPTHPALRLSPDKSEIVVLDRPASTIIVGNPNHLAVLPSTSQGLILVGRQPGATHFIALNDKGEVIMQRHVLVAAPKENYVRVRKTCAASGDDECQSTQVYYCPDTCHQIIIDAEIKEQDGDAAEAANKASQGSSNGGGTQQQGQQQTPADSNE